MIDVWSLRKSFGKYSAGTLFNVKDVSVGVMWECETFFKYGGKHEQITIPSDYLVKQRNRGGETVEQEA